MAVREKHGPERTFIAFVEVARVISSPLAIARNQCAKRSSDLVSRHLPSPLALLFLISIESVSSSLSSHLPFSFLLQEIIFDSGLKTEGECYPH